MLMQKNVSKKSRVTTIAIGERMDADHPVMQANGNLIDRVGRTSDPESCVVANVSNLGRYSMIRRSDVRSSLSVFSCPAPSLVEHPTVKQPHERLRQDIHPLSEERACSSAHNVVGFPIIKLLERRQVVGDQIVLLVRIERRRPGETFSAQVTPRDRAVLPGVLSPAPQARS